MSKMDFLNDDVIVLDSSVLQVFQEKSMEYHKEEPWDAWHAWGAWDAWDAWDADSI